MKYAVIIKHKMRDNSDIRVDIIDVPDELENVGPHEIRQIAEIDLLGAFEVLAVTDRISEQKWESK